MAITQNDIDKINEALKWQHVPKEYKEHKVFKNLQIIYDFYDQISMNSFGFMPNGLPTSVTNIDTYIASSIGGTIDSITILLQRARINDALALLRKYFDEIIVDIYQNVYRSEQIRINSNKWFFIVENIKKWKEGIFKMPHYNDALKYFGRALCYKDLFAMFDFDVRYKKIRDYLDDNMHMNSFLQLRKNDNSIYNESRVKLLNLFNNYLVDLFVLHLASIIILNPSYIMASDYRDSLEMGMAPPDGSEKWIAPFVQEVLNRYISNRKSLAQFLK